MVYQIAAAALLSCFYIAYFAKQLALKKQGIDTNRLAKGRKARRTQIIERCLLGVTYVAAVMQFASVLFAAYFGAFSLPAAVRAAGCALMLGGVAFFVLALAVMRGNWRAGIDETQKTEFVSGGVYRISRNPAFVGFDLMYIGTVLACPNVLMAVAAGVAVLLLHLQILEEEQFLTATFGGAYDAYKSKTARYILF